HPHGVPMETFATYGLVDNVRIPFAFFISFWHGLFSVVTPVVFVEYLFPKQAGQPWLPRKVTWLLAIFSVALSVAYFLFFSESSKIQNGPTLGVHLAFVVIAAVALLVAAGRLPRTPHIIPRTGDSDFSVKPFFAGLAFYLMVSIVPDILAEAGL